jgi:hypothetical protein
MRPPKSGGLDNREPSESRHGFRGADHGSTTQHGDRRAGQELGVEGSSSFRPRSKPEARRAIILARERDTAWAMSQENVEIVPTRWESLKTRRVQGIGGMTGKALALSLIGGAVYGVVKLIDLVTD